MGPNTAHGCQHGEGDGEALAVPKHSRLGQGQGQWLAGGLLWEREELKNKSIVLIFFLKVAMTEIGNPDKDITVMIPFATEGRSLIDVGLCACNFQPILCAQEILTIWLHNRKAVWLHKKTF